MNSSFSHSFPAIRGVQAGREYYVSMFPLRLIPKLFVFDEDELIPELRAQRTLNKSRVPEISRYILDNRNSYVFSALTVSINGDVRFDALASNEDNKRIGLLHVPMDARFIINDGQHRRAAIEMALAENHDLADETIAVVFFIDKGLERCQQMFADLNRYAIRPSRSLGVLYDHRDDTARVAKLVTLRSPVFRDVVEMERSTLSMRSRKLFTLSAIYTATSSLLINTDTKTVDEVANLAVDFWEEVAVQFPEWQCVRENKLTAGDIRQGYIHSHGIALHAIGKVGNILLKENPKNWKEKLKDLKKIDWTRSNAKLWEGRALSGGKVSKAGHNVTLTINVIKKCMGLELSPDEQRIEEAFQRGDHV
ncbi:DNA sulfur modification protein DndB [Geomonas nitrogeniifigens]|uniref:DNA sulfur modification protein DndB n=1 Tax=Geomonas diazotrophica TaxID=2843197 RepID=A0ABX8JJR7_9BACT|nr:DNA sulfur modification protein DndB [Geomonas nitrogeniifigens]QWV98226.1 DNA sulfur modification protein DndB [Geomonas nitrogeniifigens]